MSGLLALLDDIVALTKATAATLDDVAGQAARAGAKAAGVVIDDAAVTPRYVTGLAAQRELPIVWRIALGSLKNKLLFLLPAALVLSAFLPWAITPLLMLGGLYLCFEGYEKVHHMLTHAPADLAQAAAQVVLTDAALEDAKLTGAIRTDLVLSAEIMAIALASITATDLVTQALTLFVVGIVITVGVYGTVALSKGRRHRRRLGQNGRPDIRSARPGARAWDAAVSGGAEFRWDAGHAVGRWRHSRSRSC